jgi:hypothetical protein
MKAQGGIRIFGILFTGFNILSFLSAIQILGQGGQTPYVTIQPIAGLVAGIGVLMLKHWARRLTVFLAGYSASYGVFSLFKSGVIFPQPYRSSGIGVLVVALIWNALILWYFLRPGVKAQFQRRSAA